MRIDYLYCPHCGKEVTEPPTVAAGENRATGQTVICPECGQETYQFEREVVEVVAAGLVEV